MARLRSVNPATLARIGEVGVTPVAEVAKSVERAKRAQVAWAATSLPARAAILRRAADLLSARTEDFARLITNEEGKPLKESRTEAANTADRIRYFSEHGPEMLSSREAPVAGLDAVVEYRPRGVIAAIKPWNFPINIPAWTIAPALLAGNAVVFKPSELTPLCGVRLRELFLEAGVPRDVLRIVQGADAVGKALVASEVAMIAFVGSQSAGRAIARSAAPEFKELALELAGKDPAVVLDDADVEAATKLLVYGAFKNCGQVCCSCERVYVDRKIYSAFLESFVERTRALRIGDGLDDGVEIGPMIRRAERDRVEGLVADARRKGARIVTGGARADVGLPGYFYLPTIVTNVSETARMMKQEIFGPALPIIRVRNESEAIRRANSLPFGLTASVWTRDPERGTAVARRIQAGTVAINANTGSIVQHPWGGIKGSGMGRMLSIEGLRSFTHTVTIRTARKGAAS